MSEPDYNEVFERLEDDMIDAGKTIMTPKQSKGGVFAPSDIKIIKEALLAYVQNTNLGMTEQKSVVNLLHRLNNRI